MNCFDNIIGIKSACTGSSPVPTSGLYIEDFGITCEQADSYINEEYESGQELIEDKIEFAIKLVKQHISNNFSSSIISKSLVTSESLGKPGENLILKSGISGTLGGISLLLNNYQSYYTVFVSSISLQISTTQDVPVMVYDLISGELLDTFTVSCEANKISSTFVNKTYGSYKKKLDLIFVYDTEGISSNTTTLDYGCGSCTGYVYDNYYVQATAISLGESATKIRSSLTTTSHTFGLSIVYSVQCSLDNWMCEIQNLMVLPIGYQVAIEVMKYAVLYSNRQTSNINIDAERNQKRWDDYEKLFNKSMKATLGNISIPKKDSCFVCNGPIKSATQLPG